MLLRSCPASPVGRIHASKHRAVFFPMTQRDPKYVDPAAVWGLIASMEAETEFYNRALGRLVEDGGGVPFPVPEVEEERE